MSDRNRLLIAGLYATIGLFVVIIATVTYAYYQAVAANSIARMEANLAADQAASNPPANLQPPQPVLNAAALTRAHAQLNDLQAMLERNSRLLDKRTTLLNQKTSECKLLQEQLDGSITAVLALLDMGADGEPNEARLTVGRNLEQEFKQLKTELGLSESLELEQMQQVEQLKAELAATESQIASIRAQADAELLMLLEQQRLLDATARRAFTQLGATAVPVLVGLLSDDRAEVRAWAASILGGLGANGQDAVPALMGMLVDDNESVRNQAKRSLEQLAN